ncbi:MAG: hypothetical protein A2270_06360 [Elusimicrobia bacterium RIFOXYA12_FULL_51_18]|nr:MAG: hypothetical protein A2270_06360 [Elusimicrobia bacterium RIFOXYA12_FULL_51_18]OGS29824.1 MAG: hypothetical protein A2218_03430 [Elusimicrobia bacterium RIFOXYA2_FULL_53_38]
MKKKLVMLFGIVVLAIVPAVYSAAQTGEGADVEENESFQNDQRGPGGQDNRGMNNDQRGPGGQDNRGMSGKQRGFGGLEKGNGMRGDNRGYVNEEEILSVIKKHDPAFAGKLAELKNIAQPKYRMVLMMANRALGAARMEKDENFIKDVVRAISLEFGAKELSIKYDKAADAEKAGIKAELKVKVAELFDLRLKGQESRVKMMEKDLAKLKKNLETRRANKDKIVEERLGQLTGENSGW